MKTVILVSPKLGIGGIQRAMTNLANWLSNNGYQVTFISCKKEALFYDLDPKVTLVVPPKAHPGKGGNLVFHYWFIIRFLRQQFKTIPAQNVISFGDSFNPLVLIAAMGLGKKVHVSDRTSPDYKFKWHVKWLKLITYRWSHTFIAQTSRAALWNEKKFNNKLNIVVIPNQVREVVVDAGAPKDKVVLYVGRFAWEKNPVALIRAFAKLEQKRDWKLVLLGDGPQLDDMKQLTQTLGVATQVEFKGQVKEVDYYFSRASVYVLPSVLEGFPNALCEAMAFGLPCLTSSKIPYADLGHNEEDFLIADPDDIDAFSQALQRLLNDETLRIFLGNNAKKINERLSLEKIGRLFESILQH